MKCTKEYSAKQEFYLPFPHTVHSNKTRTLRIKTQKDRSPSSTKLTKQVRTGNIYYSQGLRLGEGGGKKGESSLVSKERS